MGIIINIFPNHENNQISKSQVTKNNLLYEYGDLHITLTDSNKNRLTFLRSNPTGHTIFVFI